MSRDAASTASIVHLLEENKGLVMVFDILTTKPSFNYYKFSRSLDSGLGVAI